MLAGTPGTAAVGPAAPPVPSAYPWAGQLAARNPAELQHWRGRTVLRVSEGVLSARDNCVREGMHYLGTMYTRT